MGFLNHQQYDDHLSRKFFESFYEAKDWAAGKSWQVSTHQADPEIPNRKGFHFDVRKLMEIYSSGYSRKLEMERISMYCTDVDGTLQFWIFWQFFPFFPLKSGYLCAKC